MRLDHDDVDLESYKYARTLTIWCLIIRVLVNMKAYIPSQDFIPIAAIGIKSYSEFLGACKIKIWKIDFTLKYFNAETDK